MRCPVDGAELRMMERQGVEIDYCPTCRGVWLDRGELDKIIDRSTPAVALEEPGAARAAREEPRREYRGDRPREDDRYSHARPYRKRKSFLSELFDFD